MSTDYNYDDKGQFFPYFVLTVTALFTVPITYSAFKPSKELENTAPRIKSNYRPEEADLIDKQRRKEKRRDRKLKRIIAALTGWLVIAWMAYLLKVTATAETKIWSPYDILGLSTSATEKDIKSRYRKLSLTQHPDKARINEAANITAETINNAWVEITKAFKALTDEEIRNNWIQYGHPDGKQSFSIGIALPQFIVKEGNGKYVLILYGALLGVVLPYLVGSWWYGTQKLTRDNILVASAGKLFTEYTEGIDDAKVVRALSSGVEFEDSVKPSKDEDVTQVFKSKVFANNDSSPLRFTNEDLTAWARMQDETRKKVFGLLWAYLGRIDLGDTKLNEEKFDVAPTALSLNESFGSMAPCFGNVEPLLATYRISQNIIQALPPGASPLLQLPFFTPKIVRNIESDTLRKNSTVQSFMDLPDQKRRKLVVGPGLLSETQYQTVLDVASQLPLLKVEKAFFKVTGEKHCTPGSMLQFVVKVRMLPPGTKNIPPPSAEDLKDVDPEEGDLDALHGRKKKVGADGKTVITPPGDPVQPTLAHAPYFARDHAPRWRIFLSENRSGKIAVPPFTFSTFDQPLFDESGKPTCKVQTLKMQFTAPGQPGKYPFTAHVICDSYVGMDSQVDVVMNIEDLSKVEEIQEEDEISEPEEDSIAGQMNALRGASSGTKPKSEKKKLVIEDLSDDSDTEGEDDDSDSDTDTDTDEE